MNIKNILLALLTLLFIACSNTEWDFEDPEIQGCYFPYQSPARTLILGKYEQGFNENDNNHRFDITVIMTGVYANEEDRYVHFEIDNSLLENVAGIQSLPSEYYTIETQSPVEIPAGDTKGRISVQLNENFFDDSLSFGEVYTTNYVIPLMITDAENLDTILRGLPKALYVDSAQKANIDHWDIQPKDFTLFGIKFMNKYHGTYLRRGLDLITSPTEMLGRVYSEEYVVDDETVFVETSGRNNVKIQNLVAREEGDTVAQGTRFITMDLSFDEQGTCNISSYKNDPYNINGSGRYVEEGDTWGGQLRDVIYLDYTYTDTATAYSGEQHHIIDTLVIRDRAAVFEEFEIVIEQ